MPFFAELEEIGISSFCHSCCSYDPSRNKCTDTIPFEEANTRNNKRPKKMCSLMTGDTDCRGRMQRIMEEKECTGEDKAGKICTATGEEDKAPDAAAEVVGGAAPLAEGAEGAEASPTGIEGLRGEVTRLRQQHHELNTLVSQWHRGAWKPHLRPNWDCPVPAYGLKASAEPGAVPLPLQGQQKPPRVVRDCLPGTTASCSCSSSCSGRRR